MEISTPLRDISLTTNLTPQGLGKVYKNTQSTLKGNKRVFKPSAVRSIFESRGFKYPSKNIVFHCLKGGASKTTLAYNTAYRLSQLGGRVLLVDLDKQGNATQSFDIDPSNIKGTFVDLITESKKIEDIIVPVGEYLDLLPSTFHNARIEIELNNRNYNPQTYYSKLFSSIRDDYDFLIFDLPPDLNRNSYLCTILADTICIPTNPDGYSVMGMKMTLESIEGLQSEFEDLDQDVYVVWSKYDARETNSFHFITENQDLKGALTMPVVIRSDSTFKNAQSNKQSVFQIPKKSNAKEDIDILAKELSSIREFFSLKGNA